MTGTLNAEIQVYERLFSTDLMLLGRKTNFKEFPEFEGPESKCSISFSFKSRLEDFQQVTVAQVENSHKVSKLSQ